MYDPETILTWLEENVQSMRQSQRKTLAAIVDGAMQMQGVGVLSLGRAMQGPALPKHRIKRVDRFLKNEGVNVDAVSVAIFEQFRPRSGEVVVLADWTDRHQFQHLALALPCDGRAIPFYGISVEKGDGSGAHAGLMIEAERMALHTLRAMYGESIRPIIIADRGFGNTRWMADIEKWGWYFVQRMANNHTVAVEQYSGALSELGIRKGQRPRDWGWGSVGEKEWGNARLITVYERKAKAPWYLLTNLPEHFATEIVRLYKRRMWIEAMFRDLKNREWGLGMDHTKLTTAVRYDRHFLIMMLAYIFLSTLGAAAEKLGLSKQFKANTVIERVLSCARIGAYCRQIAAIPIAYAISAYLELPT